MVLGCRRALEELVRRRDREIDGLDEEVLLELLALLFDEPLRVALHALGALLGVGEKAFDLTLAGRDERRLGGGRIGVGVLEIGLVLLRALLGLLEHLAR